MNRTIDHQLLNHVEPGRHRPACYGFDRATSGPRTARLIARRHQPRGFTLIEALAALVLVAVVLPAAMSGLTICLQTAAGARHRAEAAELCREKLSELLVLRDASTFDSSGSFDTNTEYRWQTASRAGLAGESEVTVTVFWQQRGSEVSASMTTLIYPPGTSATTGSGS